MKKLSGDAAADVRAWIELKTQINALTGIEKKLRANIDNYLAHEDGAEVDGRQVLQKTTHTRRTFDSRKFGADHPGMFDAYVSETVVERLTIVEADK